MVAVCWGSVGGLVGCGAGVSGPGRGGAGGVKRLGDDEARVGKVDHVVMYENCCTAAYFTI